jgi:hypothetical protein
VLIGTIEYILGCVLPEVGDMPFPAWGIIWGYGVGIGVESTVVFFSTLL